MDALPCEIVTSVLKRVRSPYLQICALVCTRWYGICTRVLRVDMRALGGWINIVIVDDSVAVCKYVLRHGPPAHTRNIDCDDMVSSGCSLELLKCARGCGVPIGWRTCALVAQRGDLAMLRWLRESGTRLESESICANAAARGDTAMMRYARKHGAPWDHNTCYRAAMFGKTNALAYAVTRGCSWNRHSCANAARQNGHADTYNWITQICDAHW